MIRAVARAIQNLLDIILPRKARVVRTENYRLEDIPVSPIEHDACGTRITTLLEYRSPMVQDLIRALKYDQSPKAATLLAQALAEYLHEEISNRRLFSAKPIVLVPVPLHGTRQRERGFNQVERILHTLPQEFRDGTRSRVDTSMLKRTRATPPQTHLSRRERLTNVQGAFAADDAALRDVHIILIDDVTTTGATLVEAAKPLSGFAASLTLLALAHA